MIIPTITTHLYQITRFKDQMRLAAARRRAAILICGLVAAITVLVLLWISR